MLVIAIATTIINLMTTDTLFLYNFKMIGLATFSMIFGLYIGMCVQKGGGIRKKREDFK